MHSSQKPPNSPNSPNKPEPPEIIEGDQHLRKNLLLICGAYILLLIWLEPMIDYLLTTLHPNPMEMANLNREKLLLSSVAYAIVRMVPVGLIFWFGYRVVLTLKLPPARMRFPFTVPCIKGKQAKMFGILLMSVCVVLFYLEMVQLSRRLIA